MKLLSLILKKSHFAILMILGFSSLFLYQNCGNLASNFDSVAQSSVESLVGVDEQNANTHLIDSDADGLTDDAEINTYGTDPDNLDTDGDGVNDGDEVKTGRNPNMSDNNETPPAIVIEIPEGDSDKDGLTDEEEQVIGTNPYNSDSDSDGLIDGVEVNVYSTNPLDADTDKDGLLDGCEVNFHRTNPLDPDTDKGGVKDGDEVGRGTNPLDKADDNPSQNCSSNSSGGTVTCVPEKCPPGQVLRNGKCEALDCPFDHKMVNGVCVPFECPPFHENVNGQCIPLACPQGQSMQGGACKPIGCPGNQVLINGRCIPEEPPMCPPGQVLRNGKCEALDCPFDHKMVNGVCAPIECPPFHENVNGQCIALACPQGQSMQGGACKEILCPPGQVLKDGKCEALDCPTGQVMRNGVCSPLPIDGGWTPWARGSWSDPKYKCGVRKATRSCTNPRPQYKGKRCIGRSNKTQTKDCDKRSVCSKYSKWNTEKTCAINKLTQLSKRSRTCKVYAGSKLIDTKVEIESKEVPCCAMVENSGRDQGTFSRVCHSSFRRTGGTYPGIGDHGTDRDRDGYNSEEDANDNDPNVH